MSDKKQQQQQKTPHVDTARGGDEGDSPRPPQANSNGSKGNGKEERPNEASREDSKEGSKDGSAKGNGAGTNGGGTAGPSKAGVAAGPFNDGTGPSKQKPKPKAATKKESPAKGPDEGSHRQNVEAVHNASQDPKNMVSQHGNAPNTVIVRGYFGGAAATCIVPAALLRNALQWAFVHGIRVNLSHCIGRLTTYTFPPDEDSAEGMSVTMDEGQVFYLYNSYRREEIVDREAEEDEEEVVRPAKKQRGEDSRDGKDNGDSSK